MLDSKTVAKLFARQYDKRIIIWRISYNKMNRQSGFCGVHRPDVKIVNCYDTGNVHSAKARQLLSHAGLRF